MKRIFRLLILFLILSSLAGITTSCAVFQGDRHGQNQQSFKYKKPLPKRYIVNNGEKAILK
jgi:hypothetical protein